jgi:hypothetical protein
MPLTSRRGRCGVAAGRRTMWPVIGGDWGPASTMALLWQIGRVGFNGPWGGREEPITLRPHATSRDHEWARLDVTGAAGAGLKNIERRCANTRSSTCVRDPDVAGDGEAAAPRPLAAP